MLSTPLVKINSKIEKSVWPNEKSERDGKGLVGRRLLKY